MSAIEYGFGPVRAESCTLKQSKKFENKIQHHQRSHHTLQGHIVGNPSKIVDKVSISEGLNESKQSAARFRVSRNHTEHKLSAHLIRVRARLKSDHGWSMRERVERISTRLQSDYVLGILWTPVCRVYEPRSQVRLCSGHFMDCDRYILGTAEFLYSGEKVTEYIIIDSVLLHSGVMYTAVIVCEVLPFYVRPN